MKAVIIKTDGSKEVVEFTNETSYNMLSGAVGGWIQCVPLGELDLWVNEEGKLDGLEHNPIATALWIDTYGNTDRIVGNAVFTSGTDDEGNTLGLSEEQIAYLMNYTAMAFIV